MKINHSFKYSLLIVLTVLACYKIYMNNTVQANEVKIEIKSVSEIPIKQESVKVESLKTIKKTEEIKTENKLSKPSVYKMSNKGHKFIKNFESCKLTAYNDPTPQKKSIGWGHQLRPGENFTTISQDKADQLFIKDTEWVNDAINRLLSKLDDRFIFSQGFVDGFGSFIYNCGEGGARSSKFYQTLQKCRYDKNMPNNINKGDWEYALNTIKSSKISAKGHYERRRGEYELMIN